MSASPGRNRLSALGWVAVLLIAGFLEYGTIATIRRVGLTGPRLPVSLFQAALHVLMAIAALALVAVFRGVPERLTLLIGAAAAASTALYGFGARSDALSAFRLLSHLAAYGLAMVVSIRRLVFAPTDFPLGSSSKKEG